MSTVRVLGLTETYSVKKRRLFALRPFRCLLVSEWECFGKEYMMIRFETAKRFNNQPDWEPTVFYVGSSREIRNIVKHLEKQDITNGFFSPVKYTKHNKWYSVQIERDCWGHDRYFVDKAEHLFDFISLGTIEVTSRC